VPIKVTHYPEYLEKRGAADYGLQPSKTHGDMEEKLRRLREAGGSITQEGLVKP
jgi:hypothetical protein